MRKTPKVVPISQAKRTRRNSIPQNEELLPTLSYRQTLNKISFYLARPLFVEDTPDPAKPSPGKLVPFPKDSNHSNKG